MKHRIVETKEGFEVQRYFEPEKQTWLDKFFNGENASGWCTLDIHGNLWGISIDHVLGMDFTEKKARFETQKKARKFINRITRDERVVCEVK